MKNLGFTLLEMMIAITILAVLTVLTTASIQSSVKSKQKYQNQIEQDAMLRDSMRVIERDVSLAYHHRDFYTDMINSINQDVYGGANGQPTPTPGPGQPTPTPGQPTPTPTPTNTGPTPTPRPAPKELTAFLGDEKSLYFTSLSFVRTQRDQQAGDQAKVGYYLKNCKSTDNRGASFDSQCIWRRISPLFDDHVDQNDPNSVETVLLENVSELKFKYYGPGHDEWQSDWKTTDSDAGKKDNFPFAVEIYIKVENKHDPKLKPIEMRSIATIRFPNNAGANNPNGGATPSPTPGQGQPGQPGVTPTPGGTLGR